MKNHNKYIPFNSIDLPDRTWPGNKIHTAPVWCSVDLRDGNQALTEPMNLSEKLIMFKLLCDMGVKEIEVGFPSASQTEFEIVRELIEGNYIPDDVTIQVLVQAREHLIEKTFEAIKGAKNVILHFYNAVSPLHREVVFGTDVQGVTDIAVEGATLIKNLSQKAQQDGTNIRYEYSPECFSDTEIECSVGICEKVLDALGATEENPVILNLPTTVEVSTPNCFADMIEYFARNLQNRDRVLISIHPHNDRGTAVATAELALLAGADRIEGTLFGNGERTGNVDIVTLALNMFTQGVDPKLDLSNLNHIKDVYEQVTGMRVGVRHPYAGELVFTAFSGSHQDAINKGLKYIEDHNSQIWKVPYIPIDPADIGRAYEPIIRINSQSGKGGAAFVMANEFGYNIPKAMHSDFGAVITAECDVKGGELTKREIFELFEREYVNLDSPYRLESHKFSEESTKYGGSTVNIEGILSCHDNNLEISGEGNGPIDAFFNALKGLNINNYRFVSYHEHAITSGSDSRAIAYIELETLLGKKVFGVGISHNINLAPIRGVISAINRAAKMGE